MNIIIKIQGGIVQEVITDQLCDILVADFDEGEDMEMTVDGMAFVQAVEPTVDPLKTMAYHKMFWDGESGEVQRFIQEMHGTCGDEMEMNENEIDWRERSRPD